MATWDGTQFCGIGYALNAVRTLIPYEKALELVLDSARGFGVEEVGIAHAGGRVLADDLKAPFRGPRFDNSAVDGYAIDSQASETLASKGKVELTLSGVVPAGGSPTQAAVCADKAARVFTGSRLPEGTSAVIMQEDAAVSDTKVLLTGSVSPGMNIRHAGDEYRKGDVLLGAGTVLSPGAIAVAASVGKAGLVVRRAPKIGIITTGSELIEPGCELTDAGVYESNSFAVLSALRAFPGTQVQRLRIVDEPSQIETGLSRMFEECDVVLTSGGASVGDFDYMGSSLQACKVVTLFHGVSMKPGKPIAFGLLGDKPVFALPGNPLSSLVCYAVFVAPYLRVSLGLDPGNQAEQAMLRDTISKKPGRLEFVPGRVHQGVVEPVRNRASNMMTGFAGANTLIVVPAESSGLSEGTLVDCLPLPWG